MDLSVVVPVYRSAECLAELARQVQAAAEGRFQAYELILVNDASPDESWAVITTLVSEQALHEAIRFRDLSEVPLRIGVTKAYETFDPLHGGRFE